MSSSGRQVLNYGRSGSDECLINQQQYGGNDYTDPVERVFNHPFFKDSDSDDNDYDHTYTTTFRTTTFSTSRKQEFYYNYWNYPKLPDNREVLPTSIRQWINSYKDPEREFCKVVAIFLFSFIVGLQVFSYAVSMFDLNLNIPYCGEIRGQLEFECHLWLFLFAWIACFICTAVVLVLKYWLYLCRSYTTTKEKTI